ncbi:MAG TPA: SpoIID/LytB domain-containing protein [Gemmatimonadaceae bacterium]|nr:SpoIID/LytB domain-containing protein [Gemmatimonadaceae bacterium]
MRFVTDRLPPRALVAALALLAAACSERGPVGPAPGAGIARDEIGIAAFTGNIRIGVVPSASSVTIGSGADYTIADKATGAVLLTGSAGTATVTLASVSQTITKYRLQVMCGSAAAVDARKAAAEALGHVTLTEPIAACTRLYIGEFDATASFTVRNNYRNLLISQGLAATDSFWKLHTIVLSAAAYRVTRGPDVVDSPNPVVLTSSDGIVSINGVRYRGVAEVRTNGSGVLLAGVNELPMEEYLYGVVPRELGPIAFPLLEAQKAQAVAARTYALSGIGKRASEGYDLLPTTSDQVYGGYDAEYPLSTQAVNETRGIAATYEGKLISALYSSTTGGHTADNEEAYNSVAIPYLRGIPDAERGAAMEHVPSLDVFRAAANPRSLRAERNGDFEGDWSRYHRWVIDWTAQEISQVVSAYAGQDVGKVLAVNVTERGPSGRALRIEYVTEAGTFTDTKDRIRSSLRYYNASNTLTSLPSTLFFIEPVLNPGTGTVTGFVAYGGGFGHGVGLSQTGAVGMAERGHTYEEILKHYYQGIALEQWY